MTLVKRIILSITRRPIKSLLLLVLSFALGTFIGSSYLISRAVNGLETNIKHNLDTYVVISYKDIDEYKNLNNLEYKENQDKFLEKYNEISMKEYVDNSSLLQYTKYTSFSSWNSNISHPSISFFVDYLKYSVSIMGTDLLFFDFYEETIDIVEGRCINKEDIENGMSTYMQELRDSNKAKGQDRIWTHGEKELSNYENVRKNGLKVNQKTYEELVGICRKIGADEAHYFG